MTTIGIFVFDEVEVLDMAGPFEVFSVAARLSGRGRGTACCRVVTVAPRPGPVVARGGFTVLPTHDIATAPPLDVLVVAGGVVTAELARPESIDWIRRAGRAAGLVTSVCTGAFLLAEAGCLAGRRVTTHWEDADDLARAFPDLTVERGPLWVDSGDIVTSAGISAGIEMSLHLVRRIAGADLARATARQMDYDWRDRGLQV